MPIVGADAGTSQPRAGPSNASVGNHRITTRTSTTCAAILSASAQFRDVCRAEAYARSPTSVGTCSKPISMHPTPTARVMSSASCATSATVSRTRSPNSTAHRRRRGQARRDAGAGAGLSRHPTRHRMSDRRGRHAREGENPRRSDVSNRSSIPQIQILAAACLRSRLVASCNSLHVLPDFPVALESGRCRSSREQTSPTPITTARRRRASAPARHGQSRSRRSPGRPPARDRRRGMQRGGRAARGLRQVGDVHLDAAVQQIEAEPERRSRSRPAPARENAARSVRARCAATAPPISIRRALRHPADQRRAPSANRRRRRPQSGDQQPRDRRAGSRRCSSSRSADIGKQPVDEDRLEEHRAEAHLGARVGEDAAEVGDDGGAVERRRRRRRRTLRKAKNAMIATARPNSPSTPNTPRQPNRSPMTPAIEAPSTLRGERRRRAAARSRPGAD